MEVDSVSGRSTVPHSIHNLNRRALLTWCIVILSLLHGLVASSAQSYCYRGTWRMEGEFSNCSRLWRGACPPRKNLVRSTGLPMGQEVTKHSPKLIDGKMGEYKWPSVNITLKKEAKHEFAVSFPLHVIDEFKQMMKDGIITPVKHSKWDTLITNPHKADTNY